MIRNRILKRIM